MRRRALLGGSLKNIETAVIPIDMSLQNDYPSYRVELGISTRTGFIDVDFGDGSAMVRSSIKNYDYISLPASYPNIITHDYGSKFVGNITIYFYKGLADCYSIGLDMQTTLSSPYRSLFLKITDFGDWIAQFPNLYSIKLYKYNYQQPRGDMIKGNLLRLPAKTKRISIESNEFISPLPYLDFDGLPVNLELEFLKLNASLYYLGVYGDLAKVSQSCKYISLQNTSGNAAQTNFQFTYTQGKVWTKVFNTLVLEQTVNMTTQMVDDLLNDMADGVETADGNKLILISTAIRSSASDTAVNYLRGLGFKVMTPYEYPANSEVINLSLDSVLTDDSGNENDFKVAHSGSNFAAGRNSKNALKVTNSTNHITSLNHIYMNSDKVTIAFWFNSGGLGVRNNFLIASNIGGNTNMFYVQAKAGKIYITDRSPSGINEGYASTDVFDDNWHHIVATIDRAESGVNQNKLYIDDVLDYTSTSAVDNTGPWNPFFFEVGGDGRPYSSYVPGLYQFFHLYNYAFDATDVSDLYNDEL